VNRRTRSSCAFSARRGFESPHSTRISEIELSSRLAFREGRVLRHDATRRSDRRQPTWRHFRRVCALGARPPHDSFWPAPRFDAAHAAFAAQLPRTASAMGPVCSSTGERARADEAIGHGDSDGRRAIHGNHEERHEKGRRQEPTAKCPPSADAHGRSGRERHRRQSQTATAK
jgi:hypothetical protein